jgi:carboxyl-terminal processing protease
MSKRTPRSPQRLGDKSASLLGTLGYIAIWLALYVVDRGRQRAPLAPNPRSDRPRQSWAGALALVTVLVIVVSGVAGLALSPFGQRRPTLARSVPGDPQIIAMPVFSVTPEPWLQNWWSKLGTPTPPQLPTLKEVGVDEAMAYFSEALDFIEQNSFMDIDWSAWRTQALAEVGAPTTRADTHWALKNALDRLGDDHSYLQAPDHPDHWSAQARTLGQGLGFTASYEYRGIRPAWSQAHMAGISAGQVIEAINGQPTEGMGASKFYRMLYGGSYVRLTLKKRTDPLAQTISLYHPYLSPYLIPEGRRLEGGIAYVRLPELTEYRIAEFYAEVINEIIGDLDRQGACGWVIDLQDNVGGYAEDMLDGLQPLLGDGVIGADIDKYGNRYDWSFYPYGQFSVGTPTPRVPSVIDPYRLQNTMPPVAVLTDRWTASAGEAVLISFRGRPNTRTFGEPTAGVPTSMSGTVLSDGALLAVASARSSDRTGRVYEFNERIQPDEYVTPTSPIWQGTDADPVLAAAGKWLRTQPGCAP